MIKGRLVLSWGPARTVRVLARGPDVELELFQGPVPEVLAVLQQVYAAVSQVEGEASSERERAVHEFEFIIDRRGG